MTTTNRPEATAGHTNKPVIVTELEIKHASTRTGASAGKHRLYRGGVFQGARYCYPLHKHGHGTSQSRNNFGQNGTAARLIGRLGRGVGGCGRASSFGNGARQWQPGFICRAERTAGAATGIVERRPACGQQTDDQHRRVAAGPLPLGHVPSCQRHRESGDDRAGLGVVCHLDGMDCKEPRTAVGARRGAPGPADACRVQDARASAGAIAGGLRAGRALDAGRRERNSLFR